MWDFSECVIVIVTPGSELSFFGPTREQSEVAWPAQLSSRGFPRVSVQHPIVRGWVSNALQWTLLYGGIY